MVWSSTTQQRPRRPGILNRNTDDQKITNDTEGHSVKAGRIEDADIGRLTFTPMVASSRAYATRLLARGATLGVCRCLLGRDCETGPDGDRLRRLRARRWTAPAEGDDLAVRRRHRVRIDRRRDGVGMGALGSPSANGQPGRLSVAGRADPGTSSDQSRSASDVSERAIASNRARISLGRQRPRRGPTPVA